MIGRNTETDHEMSEDEREIHMVNRDEQREGQYRPLVEVEVFTAPDATSHLANMTEVLVADCRWVMRRGDGAIPAEVRRLSNSIQAALLTRAEDAVLGARRERRGHVRAEVQQRSAGVRAAIALLMTLALGILIGRGLFARPDVDAPAFRTYDAPWWVDR